MTAISDNPTQRRKTGWKSRKKEKSKIDMTPMVDLGFLLISFFVITTELNQPRSTSLNMPKEGPKMQLGDSSALTVLLTGNDSLYYYRGDWEAAIRENKISRVHLYSGQLRNAIIRQKDQLDAGDKQKNRLMLLIKSTKEASYKNVIDVLDEVLINNVTKYAIVDIEPSEIAWVRKQF